MSVAELAGRTFAPTPVVRIAAEHIAEFRAAIGAADPASVSAAEQPTPTDAVAPPTFAIVVAFAAMQSLLEDPGSGLSLSRVVHGDQKFVYQRPIRAGDSLLAELTVESVRSLGGADIISTRSEISTDRGEPVCTAYATLMHRGEEAGG